MKRIVALLCLAALCLSIAGCSDRAEGTPVRGPGSMPIKTPAEESVSHQHSYAPSATVEPYAGIDGTRTLVCGSCGDTMSVAYPAVPLVDGEVFTLTAREFTERLTAISRLISPEATVRLTVDDYTCMTELLYRDTVFCQLTYYNNDSYLDNPYPTPIGPELLDVPVIRYINLLDFPQESHAPGSFEAIAMTVDPLLRESEARELGEFLAASRREFYGRYLVTSQNAVGYGHGYLVNQLWESGSVAIHAGADMPRLCVHEPEYTFSQEGVPAGYCIHCGEYVAPAGDSWTPLVSMDVVSHSNSGTDIQTGNWSDPVGAVYRNALKFWVVEGPGYNNTEYMEFALTGEHTTLSGTVTAAENSAESAVMWIEIQLDGRRVYTSDRIGRYDYDTFLLDIRNAKTVRISCTTNTNAHGYCLVTGALF